MLTRVHLHIMQPICWLLLATKDGRLEEDILKNSGRLILAFKYKEHGKRALRWLMTLMLLILEIRVGLHVKAQIVEYACYAFT